MKKNKIHFTGMTLNRICLLKTLIKYTSEQQKKVIVVSNIHLINFFLLFSIFNLNYRYV